jgi:hypothetical protein
MQPEELLQELRDEEHFERLEAKLNKRAWKDR